MNRVDWDQYFLAQAHVVALRGTCSRLKVGAVIVRNRRMIATGYNGSVADGDHCIDKGCYMDDGHCVRTIHAEANALLQCARFGVATNNTVLYVTHFPCLQCCKQIIQAGITHVYYEHDYRNNSFAVQLFEEAQVKTTKLTLKDVEITYNNN